MKGELTRFEPRRLAALIRKESVQILRDPSTLLIAFVLPMLLLAIFGFGISLDANSIRVGLVVQDDSAQATSLAQALRSSPFLDVEEDRTVPALRAKVVADDLRALVVIPQDFGASFDRGRPIPIQVAADGSQPNTANFVAAYVEGVYGSWAQQQGLVPRGAQVGVNTRFWWNPELKSRFFLIPGSIAIVMTMIGTLLTALVVAREWERGTLEAMMATPIGMGEFIASKLIPYFVLGLGSMALCTVLGVAVFGVPLRGSVLALLAISAAFLIPALGLGLFISAATKNQFMASQFALLSGFLPSFLLSGFIFEIGSMPKPIQMVTYLVPARYLIPSLQTVFVAGDSWGLFARDIGMMLLFGAIFFFLAFRATKRSLD
ncbi:MAG: ABC transporter permease [Sphingomonadales bacterium]|nr:ABC transporter permease [Sphingomonadales bacterium]MBD3774640.1 ABC transporter permease [Paracoccaceae bacterium]